MPETITANSVKDKAEELAANFIGADGQPVPTAEIKRRIIAAFQPGVSGLVEVNVQLSGEKKALENERDQASASLVAANTKLDEHTALFATIIAAASKGGSKK